MLVYRLQNAKYAHERADILSGEGAKLFGGRWNPKGLAVIYTSATPELAHSEFIMHLKNLPPASCYLITLQIPDESVLTIEKENLPLDWRSKGYPISTKLLGEAWLKKGEFLAMKVPSSIVPVSFNFLINPTHKAINDVNVIHSEPFIFDERFMMEKTLPAIPEVFEKMLNPFNKQS
jgi:RES domain-containing protein